VKNIIFDFGNVFFDLDYSLTEQGLSEVLGWTFRFDMKHGMERTLQQYETGKINTETFIWRIQKKSKHNPQGREVINAWNAMLLKITKERIDFLLQLRKSYKVYLLSNINELHAKYEDNYIKKKLGFNRFKEDCFDKVYYSHLIHLRKPNKNIYRYVIKDAKITPHETLFIDDRLENVEAAKSCGLHVVLHDPKYEITKKFKSYIKSI